MVSSAIRLSVVAFLCAILAGCESKIKPGASGSSSKPAYKVTSKPADVPPPKPPSISTDKIDKIKLGMTEKDAQDILGAPAQTFPVAGGDGKIMSWGGSATDLR